VHLDVRSARSGHEIRPRRNREAILRSADCRNVGEPYANEAPRTTRVASLLISRSRRADPGPPHVLQEERPAHGPVAFDHALAKIRTSLRSDRAGVRRTHVSPSRCGPVQALVRVKMRAPLPRIDGT